MNNYVPFLVLVGTNIGIYRQLRRFPESLNKWILVSDSPGCRFETLQTRLRNQPPGNKLFRKVKRKAANLQINILMFFIIGLFLICNTPKNIINIYEGFHNISQVGLVKSDVLC